jgi:hypothetical protein
MTKTKKTALPITQPTTGSDERILVRLSDLRLGPTWEEWLCARFDGFSLAEMLCELVAVGLWHELSRRLAEAERTGDLRAAKLLRVGRHTANEEATTPIVRKREHARVSARRRREFRTGSVALADMPLSATAQRWLCTRVKQDGSLAATLRSIVFELALVELLTEDYEAEAVLRHRLRSAGRTWTQVLHTAAAWRRGARVAGVAMGPPLAARMLDRGLFTRVPQLHHQATRRRQNDRAE